MPQSDDVNATRESGSTSLIRNAIEKLRLKLLDLTNRNRLLNFKFTETSRKFVRVIDASPEYLFDLLTTESPRPTKLFFTALPEPDPGDEVERTGTFRTALAVARQTDEGYITATRSDSDDKVNADDASKLEADLKSKVRRKLGIAARGERAIKINLAEWAAKNGITPDYDLGRTDTATRDRDGFLQTLLLPDALERKMSGIREAANLSEQELGLSTLYAAIGYLEWYDETGEERFAPLILIPVQMAREIKAGQYRYYLKGGDGADPVVNITLRERLRKGYNIEVPELNEEESFDAYYERFAEAIKDQRRWRIRRFVVIGHFSFARLAMFEDLDGEKWPDGSLYESDLLKAILDGAEPTDQGTSSEEFNVDEEHIENQVPVLITDADSSQFSAIVDAMRGRSFALKGPPGTGKSQTITNLIAAALASGKRVLFVAEKMTALEVVAKRLREAGLGHYLLELHSTKVQKKRIMDSFADRLKIRPSTRIPELANVLTNLRTTRSELTRYAALMNQPIGVTGSTLHHAYWEAQVLRRKLGKETCQHLQSLHDASAKTVTAHELASRVGILSQLTDHWSRCVSASSSDLSKHPYAGLKPAAGSAFDHQMLQRLLSRWKELVSKIRSSLESLSGIVNHSGPQDYPYCMDLAAALARLPGADPNVDVTILRAMNTPENLATVSALCNHLQHKLHLQASLGEFFENPPVVLAKLDEHAESVLKLNRVGIVGADDMSLSELKTALKRQDQLNSKMARTFALLQRLAEGSSLAGPSASDLLLRLIDAISLLKRLGTDLIALREPGLFFEHGRAAIDGARKESEAIQVELHRLGQIFSLSVLQPPAKLLQYAQALQSNGSFMSLFSSACREGKQHFALATNGRKSSNGEMARLFVEVGGILDRKRRFENDPRVAAALGSSFSGLGTDFEALRNVCQFSFEVRKRFPSLEPQMKAVQQLLLGGNSELLRDLVEALDQDALDEAAAWLSKIDVKESDDPPGALTRATSETRTAADAAASLVGIATRLPATLQTWNHGIESAKALTNTIAELKRDPHLPVLGLDPVSYTLDQANSVNAAVAVAEAILALRLPSALTSVLLSSRYAAAHNMLQRWSAYVLRQAGHIADIQTTLERQWGLSVKEFFAPSGSSKPAFEDLEARLSLALSADDDMLQDWTNFWRLHSAAYESGLSRFTGALMNGQLAAERLLDGYRYTFFWSLIADAHTNSSELANWTGARLTELRKRVVELDLEYLRVGREWLSAVLSTIEVPRGNGRGPRKEWTERALIENEAAKSQKIIPLRKLFERAGNAAKALKPCFMMSPASVAQFLSPKSNRFDLIVIDEASQMRPEEAIGTIARGHQIIVVGDPMQLPPTAFFDAADTSSTVDDEEEDELSVENESILDQALGRLRPSRELRWHYRSRHESLIAFSNKEFYRGDLVVFPSPANKSSDLGIEYVYVDNARYHSSINPIEADVVVERVADMMRTSPHRSIGVVAVNLQQKELLSSLFDRLFAEDAVLEDYRLRHEESLEPFLIMSLENVQGHERDVVVISTVYGRAEEGGQVFQRFGPINTKVGHRRLNVLFTRAKEKVLLVTSLRSEDIIVGPGSSAGVIALKGYLEFARSGRLAGGRSTGASFDSPFEKEVSDELLQAGYACEPQVGVAGYFIDLAVRHPTNRDHFMLAIECDGATYHSAKCARDRDRLRQKVLEGLGWDVYRIWSTDWFTNRAREAQKLRTHLEHLRVT